MSQQIGHMRADGVPYAEAAEVAGSVARGESTLSEAEADEYENDPDRVDLVLRFKDIPSIYGLLQSQRLDMVDLMFKNLLQIYGNQNHMYKLGAISRNLQLALGF